MNVVLGVINVALFISVAVALAYKCRRSGQAGFLWLAVPLVLLPLLGLPIAHWVSASVDRLTAGEVTGVFPFTLVETGRLTLGSLLSMLNGAEHVVWSAFVLAGILLLKQPQQDRKA